MFGIVSAVAHALVLIVLIVVTVVESGVNIRGVRPRTGGVKLLVMMLRLLGGSEAAIGNL